MNGRTTRMGARLLGSALLLAATFSATATMAGPRMLVDVNTLQVIEHEDAFQRWYPASLTKLMTAYTVFRAVKAGEITLDSPVTMSKHAAAEPPSKMYFKPGQRMTLDSALKIILVKSANDVSVAIAESISGSEPAFVERMNAEARRIGMSSSRFINPNGLPGKGQYTTARDLAVLAVTLKREFPQYASYFALEGFTTGKKQYPNFNMLIGRFDGADGMKTGFICASGFNQVSSATRNGRSVVSVVLGSESLGARADISAGMLQKGLTGRPGNVPTLGQLRPYGETRDVVADISQEICSKHAAKVRSEGRDEAGRQKLASPYIHELDRPLRFVFAGLLGGGDTAKPDGVETVASNGVGDIANVPVPIPRPTF
ncbi:D-alanyl-D-alanine carboxypeptidase [Shinella sp. AETb1-6]|uniref:D-alanyl-D-alanine carboxypeptidase family protein n=1 Tax=Shinella sumterensis TaxID=1967501 RepID=A0AA50D3Q6_9HYPH|nr:MULTISPECIES: D-alanyl-D-alanine carboxypeptidase family protein [Shinella]MCD1265540.1 D-alanyl-D-alanine carboxypeptidase [Shinella sumterensis]MXN52953.1 D-alanyl-D-alanine carboxypeptidase [Shinella sp. AETb1-6]WLR97416.1 D-alanyl-D-alanine carboxypeptidase family protein [Shinella sumterensis]WLS07168.1 D-alanyl-D-alanine carboxypeptidase family protein [Shinella sumterensis]